MTNQTKTLRTPEDLAKIKTKVVKNYSFSLHEPNVEKLKKLAVKTNLPVSSLVDEAISYYLLQLEK